MKLKAEKQKKKRGGVGGAESSSVKEKDVAGKKKLQLEDSSEPAA